MALNWKPFGVVEEHPGGDALGALWREMTLTEGRRATGDPPPERRDLTTRVLRNAIAMWFRIHPSTLAALNGGTIDLMALRLEGRRPHRPLDAAGLCPSRPVPHPWAG